MNTENDLAQQLADMLREEIDKEIVAEIRIAQLVSEGWTVVAFDNNISLRGIDDWIRSNIQHGWRLFPGRGVFESADEAVLFKLTWS